MNRLLYLDTARLGQMSPAAQRAQEGFAHLAGEIGAAIQFDELLRDGFEACNSALQRRFPGLSSWYGIGGLKESLRRLTALEEDLPVLLAARSTELMKFAAILLCRRCRNILVTDLGWPPYQRILNVESQRTQRRVTTMAIADDVLHGRIDADEVIERVSTAFVQNRCDGLFLTSVNNFGARLPVDRITRAIGRRCRFVVVDGAQDYCHVGLDAPAESCDLYLAGCHKWLGGFHPLGAAIYGRTRTRTMIEAVLDELLDHWQLDDPLLRFVEGIHAGRDCDPGETVNLAALFSCAGAIFDAQGDGVIHKGLEGRLRNSERIAAVAADCGWEPRLLHNSLRSGILLLDGTTPRAQCRSASETRAVLQDGGVVATAYDGGVLRLSMPAQAFDTAEIRAVGDALNAIA